MDRVFAKTAESLRFIGVNFNGSRVPQRVRRPNAEAAGPVVARPEWTAAVPRPPGSEVEAT